MSDAFLRAQWKNLIMANYAVDPSLLRPYVPSGTELDSWKDTFYVSLVGFLFEDTRVHGLSFPFHRTFEEVNLRFYVRRFESGVWRRGVVFIKEIVPRSLITCIAKTVYHEHYATHAMRHRFTSDAHCKTFEYSFKSANGWNTISAKTNTESIAMAEGSEQEFIAEHYWGYTRINEKKLGAYEVRHPRWDIYPVMDYHIACDIGGLYGEPFAKTMARNPDSVFVAKGSPIEVMKKTVIEHI